MAIHSKKIIDSVKKIVIATITIDQITEGMSSNDLDIVVTDEDGNVVTED